MYYVTLTVCGNSETYECETMAKAIGIVVEVTEEALTGEVAEDYSVCFNKD